ncbi:MAG: hypothetical protein ACRD0G_15070 [Acidimicrobiales bacterium]
MKESGLRGPNAVGEFAGVTRDELAAVIDAALRAMPSTPEAGTRCAEALLAAAAAGHDDLVDASVTRVVGFAAPYAVRSYATGDLVPVADVGAVSAADALRLALAAQARDEAVEVVAVLGDDERCVLARRPKGSFEVCAPIEDQAPAPADRVATVVESRSELVDAVREAMASSTVDVEMPGIDEWLQEPLTNAVRTALVSAIDDVAAHVSARLNAPGGAAGPHGSITNDLAVQRLLVATEMLAARVDQLADDIRTIKRGVDSLDETVVAGERRLVEHVDDVGARVTSELHRGARMLDHELDELKRNLRPTTPARAPAPPDAEAPPSTSNTPNEGQHRPLRIVRHSGQ